MKVGIEGDDDPSGSCIFENVSVGRSRHADLTDVGTFNAGGTEVLGCIPRQAQIEKNMKT